MSETVECAVCGGAVFVVMALVAVMRPLCRAHFAEHTAQMARDKAADRLLCALNEDASAKRQPGA